MEVNYDGLRVVELKALIREHGFWDYSGLRKAELVTFLQDNIQPRPTPASSQSIRL